MKICVTFIGKNVTVVLILQWTVSPVFSPSLLEMARVASAFKLRLKKKKKIPTVSLTRSGPLVS